MSEKGVDAEWYDRWSYLWGNELSKKRQTVQSQMVYKEILREYCYLYPNEGIPLLEHPFLSHIVIESYTDDYLRKGMEKYYAKFRK